MAIESVEQLRSEFGDDRWKAFLRISPEWLKDLDGQSKSEISDLLREEFSESDADHLAAQVSDFFTHRQKGDQNPDGDGQFSEGRQRLTKEGFQFGDTIQDHGNVFHATRNDAKFVIKFIEKKQEAEAEMKAKDLNVPNAVVASDVFSFDGYHALVFKHCSGTLENHRDLSSGDIAAGTESIRVALEHLHQSGYVHMDVKPGNIYIDDDGKWLLGDFGSLTAIGGDPRTCTDRHLPPDAKVVAEPATDAEMFKTTLAIVLNAHVKGGNGDDVPSADRALGYRPQRDLRDEVFAHADVKSDSSLKAELKKVTELSG